MCVVVRMSGAVLRYAAVRLEAPMLDIIVWTFYFFSLVRQQQISTAVLVFVDLGSSDKEISLALVSVMKPITRECEPLNQYVSVWDSNYIAEVRSFMNAVVREMQTQFIFV